MGRGDTERAHRFLLVLDRDRRRAALLRPAEDALLEVILLQEGHQHVEGDGGVGAGGPLRRFERAVDQRKHLPLDGHRPAPPRPVPARGAVRAPPGGRGGGGFCPSSRQPVLKFRALPATSGTGFSTGRNARPRDQRATSVPSAALMVKSWNWGVLYSEGTSS